MLKRIKITFKDYTTKEVAVNNFHDPERTKKAILNMIKNSKYMPKKEPLLWQVEYDNRVFTF